MSIATSVGKSDLEEMKLQKYPNRIIIDSSTRHQLIRIPETKQDAKIMEMVEGWESSFLENGYFISTGPVVEHRTREYISNISTTIDSIPLFRMHNVKSFNVEWSGDHRKDARFLLLAGHEKHVTKNKTYLILKRFSSKDEKRRLVAGVYHAETKNSEIIALENHLNYIGLENGNLSLNEVYGLAVLFNSTILDRYFRCISGNTQVNATEIRLLRLPARKVVSEMGKIYRNSNPGDQKEIDQIVEKYMWA